MHHIVQSSKHNTLALVIGPFFPHSDDKDQRDFYCASMFALLKPWHKVKDLKGCQWSWETAFDEFVAKSSKSTRDKLVAIQYYYDS